MFSILERKSTEQTGQEIYRQLLMSLIVVRSPVKLDLVTSAMLQGRHRAVGQVFKHAGRSGSTRGLKCGGFLPGYTDSGSAVAGLDGRHFAWSGRGANGLFAPAFSFAGAGWELFARSAGARYSGSLFASLRLEPVLWCLALRQSTLARIAARPLGWFSSENH